MVPKRKLLVTATPNYLRENFLPLMEEMSNYFEIVIVTIDRFTSPGVVEKATNFEKKGTIRKFIILPPYELTLKMMIALRQLKRQLKGYSFDIWLAESSIEIYPRYLAECVIPKNCIRVLFNSSLQFLLKKEFIVRRLLAMDGSPSFVSTETRNFAHFRSFIEKIQGISMNDFPRRLWKYSKTRLSFLFKMFREFVWRRGILSKLILGKVFLHQGYDWLTQLDSGKRFEHYIFCDKMEVEAFKVLFGTHRVYLAQHPVEGICHCRAGIQDKFAILSPLTGFPPGNVVMEKYLSIFYRDLKMVFECTHAKSIHLRCHPREKTGWPQQLRDFLTAHGMHVEIVDCGRPIQEIMCNYMGIAGVTSIALRVGRASCQCAFVVGFEAASEFIETNARFRFGDSTGIGWINKDGSYDPSIFRRNNYIPPPRKRVPDLLKELTNAGTYEN